MVYSLNQTDIDFLYSIFKEHKTIFTNKSAFKKFLSKCNKKRLYQLFILSRYYQFSKGIGCKFPRVAFPMLFSFLEAYITERKDLGGAANLMTNFLKKYLEKNEVDSLLNSLTFRYMLNISRGFSKRYKPTNLQEFIEILYQIRCAFIHQAYLPLITNKPNTVSIDLISIPNRKGTKIGTKRKRKNKKGSFSIIVSFRGKLQDLQFLVEEAVLRDLKKR